MKKMSLKLIMVLNIYENVNLVKWEKILFLVYKVLCIMYISTYIKLVPKRDVKNTRICDQCVRMCVTGLLK